MKDYRIIDTAYKHGIAERDIRCVIEQAVSSLTLREEPEKFMLFGFDTAGRALEVGCFTTDQGERFVMHAMKLRKAYEKYLA
jgi:hypothetical protein